MMMNHDNTTQVMRHPTSHESAVCFTVHIPLARSLSILYTHTSVDTTPWTGVTLHSHVHHKEIQARTCSGTLFASVKPVLAVHELGR